MSSPHPYRGAPGQPAPAARVPQRRRLRAALGTALRRTALTATAVTAATLTAVGLTAPASAAVPQVNRHALTIVKTKLGHRYVWGATGPKHFDCSGLMQYSYRRAGRHIPRLANAQYHAAHRIPYSHMRPGDLVFYHDHGHRGYTFHVGMYVSRGRTIAAVDRAQGVTWQRINFADASFGSFTHR